MIDYKNYKAEEDRREYSEWSGKAYMALAVVFLILYAIVGTMDYEDQIKQPPSCEVKSADYGRETVKICKSQ